jgi:hypothetical protein
MKPNTMKTKEVKTLMEAQEEAVEAIYALRMMAKPLSYSRTKRLPRSVGPILRRYRAFAEACGYTPAQASQQQSDIIDMVVLKDNADE